MVIAPKGLRRGIDGDGPPVGLAPLVEPLPKIPDQQIPAHLQVGHRALKVLFALFAESGQAFELEGVQLILLGKLVHDVLLAQADQTLVPAAVKVIAVPPPVGKVGEPGFGDKPGFPAEKLAVGHLAAAGDQLPPLPGVLLWVAGPPIEVGGVLLGRETVDLVFEKGQESNFVDPVDELLPAADAAGIVPIHSPHDPLAVLYGHGARLLSH